MADTVSAGGVTTQGSRTYLFGTSSGIDTSALVDIAYKARTSEADKIDVKVTANNTKADAYNQMQTLSKAVQTSLATLKKPFGFASTTNNYVFDMRSGVMTSSTSTDPTKLLTVSIDPGTSISGHEIQVIQKAKANRIGSDPTTSATTALGYTGSFDLGLAGGTSATVNVTSGMTLTDIATAINGTTATSGVSASVLKVDDTHYQLVMAANTTAKAITFSNVTGTNVLGNIGITSTGTTPKNVLQTADKAILKLDDVTVTRDSNQVDDLISGVHITINNADPATTIDLDIQNDTSSLKDSIETFINAYNDLRDFVIKNQTVASDGSVADDAVLHSDNLLKSLSSNLQGLISSSYGNGGTSLSTLRELGITLDANNKFVVDETTLDNAIISKYDDVKNIFSTSWSANNSQFTILGNTSKQKSLSFDLQITYSGGAITGASVGGNNSLFTVSGTSIVGKSGTPYEGLSFAYVGTASTTVHVDFKQGISDLVYNNVDNYTNAFTGSIKSQLDDIGDQNADMNSRAALIRQRADDYREKLIDKYAKYESQIEQSKNVLAQLKAILGTSDN